jgi:AcrR family transcriptional regulator
MISTESKIPRPKGRPVEFDAGAALDAAILVFQEKGYDGASLEDLVASMGINRSSIYQAFGDKRGLFLRAFARYREMSAPVAAFESSGSLWTSLEQFLTIVANNATRPGRPHGCLITAAVLTAAGTDPEIRSLLRETCNAADAAIAARVQLAIDRGELPVRTSPSAIAGIVTSLMYALSIRAKGGSSRPELHQFIKQSLEALSRPYSVP